MKKGVTFSGFHKHNNQWCFVSEYGALDCMGYPMKDIILQNQYAELSTNILEILEEYKPHIIGKIKVDLISGIMRNSYDNYKGIKGVATLDKNRCFIPRASVILSGEVGIEETANVGRSLRVIFATAYFDEVTKESLEKLKENSNLLNKLGRSLLKEGLKMTGLKTP